MNEMDEREALTPEDAPDKKERETVTMGQDLYQTLRSLACVVLIIVLLFTFVLRITVVDGSSMENSFFHGDVVLTWSLAYTPRQGDVVVVTQKSFKEQSIIKRVIATEGQVVDIDYDTNTVYVDGVALEEDYIKEVMHTPWSEHIDHAVVPEGCVFVMGDNRNNSQDSRSPAVGMVDERCVIGRAVFVLFPFARMGLV